MTITDLPFHSSTAKKTEKCFEGHCTFERGVMCITIINHCSRRHFSNPYSFIQLSQFHTDLGLCISSLQACALHKNLSKGKQIHSWMLVNGLVLNSLFATTSLINLYSKCNRPHEALSVFNTAHDRNLFTWNALIAGFVSNGLSTKAFEFYRKMRYSECFIPDEFTFPCVIKACCDLSEVVEAGRIRAELFKIGLDSDPFIASSLINFYLKYGFMSDARRMFEEMPNWERDRDVVLWNAMINGYAQSGLVDMALEVFVRMVREEGLVPSKFTVTGILSVCAMISSVGNGRAIHGFAKKLGYESDVVVPNSLIDMYGKCKIVDDAVKVFQEIPERDIFSWNSIISVREQSADYNEALWLFDKMRESGFLPDVITITSVLQACSQLSALMRGREIHCYIVVNGMRNQGDCVGYGGGNVNGTYLENAVMDMYAKCGSLKDAKMVFNKMKDRDVASWNIMIMGYGMHSYGDEAIDVFQHMLSDTVLKPDEVTFVNVLSACSHAGLVHKGREILKLMESVYNVTPTVEHFACVVDMLGRAGYLSEAFQLAKSTPFERNPVIWNAVLAACRLHGNASLAEIAARMIVEIEPEHSGSYVLISNVYGSIGRYEDVSDLRKTMRTQNVRKTPGCSWIELMNGLHVFVNGDQNHPECGHIYARLGLLTSHLHEYDYIIDFSHL